MAKVKDDSRKQILKNIAKPNPGKKEVQKVAINGNPSKLEGRNEGSVVINDGIQPEVSKLALAKLVDIGGSLGDCVQSMVTNTARMGFMFVPRDGYDDNNSLRDPQVIAEKEELDNLFTAFCSEESWDAFREKLDLDKETTGECYIEIIRDKSGKVQTLSYARSIEILQTDVDIEQTQYTIRRIFTQGGKPFVKSLVRYKRFRRYVQTFLHTDYTGAQNSIQNYFKEFGDPRTLDRRTGEYVDPKSIEEQYKANEMIRIGLPSPHETYGVPRWRSKQIDVLSSKQARDLNYETLSNNNIPRMIVTVSGGNMTGDSLEALQDSVVEFEKNKNMSQWIVLESEIDEDNSTGNGKIDIKTLESTQTQDQMFQNLLKNNDMDVRQAFRLPPILLGRSDDYSRSTTESAKRIADEQVFGPERNRFDDVMNNLIFPDLGIKYYTYRSNSPISTDSETLAKIVSEFEKTGAITPEISRSILESILNRKLPELDERFPLNQPMTVTLLKENRGEAPGSNIDRNDTSNNAVAKSEDDLQKVLQEISKSLYGSDDDV